MSAPDTKAIVQVRYHRWPLIGFVLVCLGVVAFIFLAQLAPDEDAIPSGDAVTWYLIVGLPPSLTRDRSKRWGHATLSKGGVGLMKFAVLPGKGDLGASYFVRLGRSPFNTDARTFSR